MSNQSQHSIQPRIASQGMQELAFSEKRRLTIDFDHTNLTVFINNNFVPPISWFLTDEAGELASMGQIEDQNFSLDLTGLPTGVYYLRVAGEVHMIQH